MASCVPRISYSVNQGLESQRDLGKIKLIIKEELEGPHFFFISGNHSKELNETDTGEEIRDSRRPSDIGS